VGHVFGRICGQTPGGDPCVEAPGGGRLNSKDRYIRILKGIKKQTMENMKKTQNNRCDGCEN
jgi:hypothetical protein